MIIVQEILMYPIEFDQLFDPPQITSHKGRFPRIEPKTSVSSPQALKSSLCSFSPSFHGTEFNLGMAKNRVHIRANFFGAPTYLALPLDPMFCLFFFESHFTGPMGPTQKCQSYIILSFRTCVLELVP